MAYSQAESKIESMETEMNMYEENTDIDRQIEICLKSFDCLDLGGNLDMFKRNVGDLIKGSYFAFKPPTDPLNVLLNATITCGAFLRGESKLWLERIRGRLRGKTSIRHPHQCDIVRNMPFHVVKLLRDAIIHTRNREILSSVVHDANKKCHIISFTSMEAVLSLLSMCRVLIKAWSNRTLRKT